MARKVILDVDPGIDDAVALCMALFDPELEVLAVTAVGGNVPPEQATRNVQAIIEQLDPPRLPRVGVAVEPERPLPGDTRRFHGGDGLGNCNFEVAELHHRHTSDKVIGDIVRAAPEEVTIVTMGPLTNIANAFRRDPKLPSQVGQLIICGGSVTAPGNITPAAEFNILADPIAAQAVFRAATTKTLVPLDITQQVVLTYDMFDQLPPEETDAGALLRKILPFSFRAHHDQLGLEGVYLQDPVALALLSHPELFETQLMSGDVEVAGELTQGATVFDRRPRPEWRPNMEVATSADTTAVVDYVLRALKRAGQR